MKQFMQFSTTIYSFLMFTCHKMLLITSYVHGSLQAGDYDYLNPGVWADQRNHQGGYLVIPQRTGWITSYPPVVIGYIMQT